MVKMSRRKYNLDETIFEKIDSEEKAYWLGFFTADGCITENKIRLSLKAEDYSHLLKWKRFTKWNGKDYYHKDTNAWEVYFRSTKIKNDLTRFGVTPRKTFTLRFPYDMIDRELIHHYIRGVFDADGCITKQVRKTVKPSGKLYIYEGGEFSIGKCLSFVKDIQKIVFIDTLHLPSTSLNYSHKSIARIRYGGIDQLAIIFHYLYDDATIYLERKFRLFKDILSRRERLNERTPEMVKQQSELYSNVQSAEKTRHRLIKGYKSNRMI